MAKNPLQDQLLKAGLVKQKDVNKVNKQQDHQARVSPVSAPKEATLLAQQAQAEKLARDRALAEQAKEALRLKEINARIRQIILHSRITRDAGETAYHFTDNTTIKKIFVTPLLAEQLSRGQLAIVMLDQKYELVPLKVAEKIRELDASVVIALHVPEKKPVAEDDPYADYQIPDDLMW